MRRLHDVPPDPERAAAPGEEPGADGSNDGVAAETNCSAHYDADDVTADAHAARALRSFGRDAGMVPVSEALADIVADWSGTP